MYEKWGCVSSKKNGRDERGAPASIADNDYRMTSCIEAEIRQPTTSGIGGAMDFIFHFTFALFFVSILCLSLALLASPSYLNRGGGNLNPFRL